MVSELVASLWAELGAVEGERRHSSFAIDPEALLVFSAELSDRDPWTDDLIDEWCARNARLLSRTRVERLARDVRPEPPIMLPERDVRGARPDADLARPALLSLRLRAAFGVNARAELLGYLLAEPGRPRTITRLLDEVAYERRAITHALEGLRLAGWVGVMDEARPVRFLLERPEPLRSLVGDLPKFFMRWRALFRVLRALLAIDRPRVRDRTMLNIEMMHLEERMVPDLAAAGLERPYFLRTTGEPFSETLARWALELVRDLAAGRTDLFEGV